MGSRLQEALVGQLRDISWRQVLGEYASIGFEVWRLFERNMTEEGLRGDLVARPVFTISLDMELAWGSILNPENEQLTLLRKDPQECRGTISSLLELLERYNVPATWAVVGHLFLDADGAKELVHQAMPEFGEGWISWECYSKVRASPLYCGKDIVEKILASSVKHEIGLHSFFHIPFSQCSREVAQTEVEQGMGAACRFGVIPRSFIFPQNKIGHIDVLKENGIEIYRGANLPRQQIDHKSLVRRLNRLVDKIIAPSVSPVYRDGIWDLPSSMAFINPHLRFPALRRARLGLCRAIRAKKVFHIWLHPWNLLLHERLGEDLGKVLALVARKRDQGKIEVMTMGDLTAVLNERRLNHEDGCHWP